MSDEPITKYIGKLRVYPTPSDDMVDAIHQIFLPRLSHKDVDCVGVATLKLEVRINTTVTNQNTYIGWDGTYSPDGTMEAQIEYVATKLFSINSNYKLFGDIRVNGPTASTSYVISVVGSNVTTSLHGLPNDADVNPDATYPEENRFWGNVDAATDASSGEIKINNPPIPIPTTDSTRHVEITRKHVEALQAGIDAGFDDFDVNHEWLTGPHTHCPNGHKCSSSGGDIVDTGYHADLLIKFCKECGEKLIPCEDGFEQDFLESNKLWILLNNVING